MKTTFFSLIAASSLVFTACKKNHAGTSTVDYQVHEQNATTGEVQWTGGSANIGSVSFKSSGGTAYSATINKSVDLFTSASVLGAVSVPAGSYTVPDYEVSLQAAGATSALHLTGSFNDGTSTVPVTVDITDNVTVKVIKDSLSTVEGSSYTATFSIDLNALMQGIAVTDLTSAEQNGQITISSSSNNNLYSIISNNITGGEAISFQFQ